MKVRVFKVTVSMKHIKTDYAKSIELSQLEARDKAVLSKQCLWSLANYVSFYKYLG